MYGERTKRCEFHSISRPLTIERVRSSVCTQDISTEKSFRGGRFCGMQRETCCHPSVPSDPDHPSSGLVFPAISPRDGVKDFRLRFVVAFVPLCSVSSPLHEPFRITEKNPMPLLQFFILTGIRLFSRDPSIYLFAIFFVLYCVSPYVRAKLHSCEIDFEFGNIVIKLIAETNVDVFRNSN